MKKTNVLKDNHSFDDVINNGKKVSNRHYSIFYMDNVELETFKIGISVGKKTGHAPFRNKQKRIVRSIVDQIHTEIEPKQYVIISRKSATNLTFEEQLNNIRNLFRRIYNEKTN